MKLIAHPTQVNISHTVKFVEPMLHLAKDEERISFLKKLMKAFDLRLNDIKIDHNAPSNNFFHFYKFYGPSFFDVNFGLEEITARLGTPIDPEQVKNLYGKLHQIFEGTSIFQQGMTIDRHLVKEKGEEVDSFLKFMIPNIPREFQDSLVGRGAIYNLRNEEHQLFSQVMLTNSLIFERGVFLNMVFNFSPNKYDFEKSFEIVKSQHDFILSELNIDIESEVTNGPI